MNRKDNVLEERLKRFLFEPGKTKRRGRLVCFALLLTAIFWLPGLASPPLAVPPGPEPLTVAMTGKYPPFSFYDRNGKLAGFDVDVSRAVAREMGRPLKIVTTEWDGILAGLLAGKFDAIIGSMAITPERRRQVDFSRPYYVSGAQLFVRTGEDGIDSIDDLAGRRVGVVLGETYEHYLTENDPEIETVTYKSTVDIYQDMANGRLDGFVTDRLVGSYQIKAARQPFRPAGELLYRERMGIPVAKDRPELLTGINRALADLEKSGFMAELHRKWFGPGAATGRKAGTGNGMNGRTIAVKLARGFGITIGVAVLSLLCGFLLAVPAGVVLNGTPSPLLLFTRTTVDFVRGTPVLIQLFFVYFGAPQIGLTLSPLTSAVITLSINGAAYMAEVVRSGLMAVPPGQKLAARALGLNRWQVFRFVVWPQAFRIAIPPLVNSAVALLKDTALVSVISVAEVVRQAQSIISVTYNPMKYYFIVALMFFVFTYPLMKFAGRWEKTLKERGYSDD